MSMNTTLIILAIVVFLVLVIAIVVVVLVYKLLLKRAGLVLFPIVDINQSINRSSLRLLKKNPSNTDAGRVYNRIKK